MGQIGDASTIGTGADAAQKLDDEPITQHRPGGQGDDAYDEDQKQNKIDLRARKEQEIAPHHSGNCAGGSDERHHRIRRGGVLRQVRADAGDEIE